MRTQPNATSEELLKENENKERVTFISAENTTPNSLDNFFVTPDSPNSDSIAPPHANSSSDDAAVTPGNQEPFFSQLEVEEKKEDNFEEDEALTRDIDDGFTEYDTFPRKASDHPYSYLNKIMSYTLQLSTDDKNLKSFKNALKALHDKLKADIRKQMNKKTSLDAIKQSPASKIAFKTAELLFNIEYMYESKELQKQAFDDYRKDCQQLSRFGTFAKAVAAVCITGICCVVSGALGFALGCVIGSAAGPVGAVTLGTIAIPKSAAIGATAGTAIGAALGLSSGSWMSWRLFQPKTVQLAQKMADAGKKYYAGKSC